MSTSLNSNAQAERQQLERLLASANFARNERQSRFLRYVVERHLEGRDSEIKESVIAMEVFGNNNYDPKQDSIVRTEAGRLRARLAEYYQAEGSRDPVIIQLPKGGYVPVFRHLNGTPKEPKTSPSRRWVMIAVGSLVIAVGIVVWWKSQRPAVPIPIAVLPLRNVSQDSTNDYFADGLTDQIIRDLSIIDGLVVRSETSSFALRGKPRNVREAGKQLDAEYILEGSVLREGRQVRIHVQLVRVHDDFPVWSGQFDRAMTDIFAIQDEISRGIVNNLRLKLGRGRRRYETSTEAYDLYLRALALPLRRGFSGLRESVDPLKRVIEKDPSFAPAYAGLAAAYAARSGVDRFDRDEELVNMRVAAEKAIELDPMLAEAHDALGMVYARDAQWEQSEKSFRRAIQLDTNRTRSYNHYALYLLLPLGRIDEALRQVRIAESNDPLFAGVHYALAYVLISAGRFDEAAAHCEKLPAEYPSRSECLGRARYGQGRIDEAVEILRAAVTRTDGADDAVLAYLGYAYARAGRRGEAEKIAAAATALRPFVQALAFSGLGDKDHSFEALNRMAPLGPFRIGRTLTFPELALLRGDPRLKALRKNVGLPE